MSPSASTPVITTVTTLRVHNEYNTEAISKISFLVPDWIKKEAELSPTGASSQRTKNLKKAFALLGINPAAQVIVVTENSKRTVEQIYAATMDAPKVPAAHSAPFDGDAKREGGSSGLNSPGLPSEEGGLAGEGEGAGSPANTDTGMSCNTSIVSDGNTSSSSSSGILVKTILHAFSRSYKEYFAVIRRQFPVCDVSTDGTSLSGSASMLYRRDYVNASTAGQFSALDSTSTSPRPTTCTDDSGVSSPVGGKSATPALNVTTEGASAEGSFYFKPQFSKGHTGFCWQPLLPKGAVKQALKQEQFLRSSAPPAARDPKGEFVNYARKGSAKSLASSNANTRPYRMDASVGTDTLVRMKPKPSTHLKPSAAAPAANVAVGDCASEVLRPAPRGVAKSTKVSSARIGGEAKRIPEAHEETSSRDSRDSRDSFIASYVADSVQQGLASADLGASAMRVSRERADDVITSSGKYNIPHLSRENFDASCINSSGKYNIPHFSRENSDASCIDSSGKTSASSASNGSVTKASTNDDDYKDEYGYDENYEDGDYRHGDDDEQDRIPAFIVRSKPRAPAAAIADPDPTDSAATYNASKWHAENIVSAAVGTAVSQYTQSLSGFTDSEDRSVKSASLTLSMKISGAHSTEADMLYE